MQTELTQAQIEQFRQQGFTVIEGFLNAAELEQWRAATEDAIRVRLADSQNLSNQADPDAFYAQVFTQCLRLADIHAGMAALIFDERLGRVAGTLAVVVGIRIWHDQALVKPPYGNHTALHLDNPTVPGLSPGGAWALQSARPGFAGIARRAPHPPRGGRTTG